MLKQSKKVLANVFISMGGNQLQLVDVIFTQKIKQILPRLDRIIDWSEISTREKWKRFKKQVTFLSDRQYYTEDPMYDGDCCLLIPGAIDTHVHFDTPGFEDREDFEHGSLAAAYGGVTTVVDMPCTSIPPVTNLKNFHTKLNAVTGHSLVDYAFWGGISGADFEKGIDIQHQIRELSEAGVVGYKAYLTSGMETFTDLTPKQMLQAAHWVQSVAAGRPLAVHAEDRELVVSRQYNLRKAGNTDWRAYCQSRDQQAEAAAIEIMIDIARQTKCWIHIVHLSSKAGLELVRRARDEGLDISAETCPHYLYFTMEDFDDPAIGNFLKTAPPVKTKADRDALWEGLKDGTLSFVTTDHAGCDPDIEKSQDNFWEVYGGIPGVEHRVPFLFSEGFKRGKLTLSQTINLISTNPARFCGIFNVKGSLDQRKDADMTLVNLWDSHEITAEDMHSKGRYTPFEGVIFDAKVKATFLRGTPLRGDEPDFGGALVLRYT